MVQVSAKVDLDDLRALSEVIKRAQEETGRSAEDAVSWGALKVAESGRSDSKLGKKNRASIPNPEWKQARGSFAWARRQERQGKSIPVSAQNALNELSSLAPLLIVHMRQQKPPVMLPSFKKKDSRREIESAKTAKKGGRGLAKKTWGIMVGKLGAMKSGGGNARGKDYRISKYKEQFGETKGSVAVRLVNGLTYLEDAYPGITSRAIRKGTKAIEGYLDRRIERMAQRANR